MVTYMCVGLVIVIVIVSYTVIKTWCATRPTVGTRHRILSVHVVGLVTDCGAKHQLLIVIWLLVNLSICIFFLLPVTVACLEIYLYLTYSSK